MPKLTTVQLGDQLDASLGAFCEAQYGANKSEVIRSALRALIERDLASSSDLRKRYEAILNQQRSDASVTLRLVDADK